jgi:hypothetical protein
VLFAESLQKIFDFLGFAPLVVTPQELSFWLD